MRVFVTRRDAMSTMMLAVLAGCTRRDPPERATGPTTISWAASTLTNRSQEPRQALIDAFERAFPSITVQLISAPTSTDQERQILRDALSRDDNAAPDVYLGDVIWPVEFARDGLARPLDDVFPATFWSRFPEDLVKAASYQGKTYAAPFYVDQGILLFRKDLLARKHQPNPPKTWEQLAAAARVLLDDGDVDYGFVWEGAAYEGLTCVWTEFTAGAQSPGPADTGPADTGPADTGQAGEAGVRVRVDTPESLKALTFMRRLLTSGISPMDVMSYREAQAGQAFQTGAGRGAAFQRAWTSAYFDAAELGGARAGDTIGVAPLPVFAGQPGRNQPGRDRRGASTTGGWSLCVNPRTRQLRQVADFIEFLTDAPAQLTLAQYSVIPANKTVRDEQAVQRNPGLAAATRVRPVHRPSAVPEYRRVSQVIYSELHRALLGAIDPATALHEAQRRIDGILD
ncbi:MAG TPA: extracellular solute-binding protein [Streptosporangiaceae bacterium]